MNIFNSELVLLSEYVRNSWNVKRVWFLVCQCHPRVQKTFTRFTCLTCLQFRAHFSKHNPPGVNICSISAVSSVFLAKYARTCRTVRKYGSDSTNLVQKGSFYSDKACKPSGPLQHLKMPRTPNLSKICPDDCFSGFQSGGPKFVKNLSKIWKTTISRQIFKFSTNFWQIWVPLIGTPKNNRRDKFLTNLGFGAFLNAVRGRRVRKTRH